MPKELDFSKLQALKPRARSVNQSRDSTLRPEIEIDTKSANEETPRRWPSREAPVEGQFTIRAKLEDIDRFKAICKEDRRTYGAMLGILLDMYLEHN
jgi:hypothetical protein